MKRAELTPMEGIELEYAKRAIAAAGLDPADFALEQELCEQELPFGQSRRSTVISVTRVTTGAQRLYGTGRGGGWPHEFELDLRDGVYGRDFPTSPGAQSGQR
jgi:hypothetical protein